MEEAPENGKESSYSVHAKGVSEWMNEWMVYTVKYNAKLDLPRVVSSVYFGVHSTLCF